MAFICGTRGLNVRGYWFKNLDMSWWFFISFHLSFISLFLPHASQVAFIVYCNAAAVPMYRSHIYRSSTQSTALQVHFLAVLQCSSRRRDRNTTTATCRNAAAVDYERIFTEKPILTVNWLYGDSTSTFPHLLIALESSIHEKFMLKNACSPLNTIIESRWYFNMMVCRLYMMIFKRARGTRLHLRRKLTVSNIKRKEVFWMHWLPILCTS